MYWGAAVSYERGAPVDEDDDHGCWLEANWQMFSLGEASPGHSFDRFLARRLRVTQLARALKPRALRGSSVSVVTYSPQTL